MNKKNLPILIAFLALVLVFTPFFIIRQNYEFLAYVGVVIIAALFILFTDKKLNYPRGLLWCLWVWATLHLAGGGIVINNGEVLYRLILIDIVGEPYNIFKYDQLVHMWGFGVAAYLSYVLLKPSLNLQKISWGSLSLIVVMVGLGFGALNEIIEFSATVFFNETGVGGYENTSLDLVSNLVGAVIAMYLVYKKEKNVSTQL